MPTELEELVEFLHHGNTQVRQIACDNLVGYSSDAKIFKRHQLLPVRDLKLLVRDYPPISKNALIILINLSHDAEILKLLASDDDFIEILLKKITDAKDATHADVSSLLANLVKFPALATRLITLTRPIPTSLSTSLYALDQLIDLFTRGTPDPANFDHLSYLFADLSNHAEGRQFFLTRQPYDSILPITKLTPFTEHPSLIRRRGVASTLKNCAFEVHSHAMLLAPEPDGANLLPYLLLPLAGNEEYSDEEMEKMPTDLQFLPPTKVREQDPSILVTHLDTLLLLTTSRPTREKLRESGVYPIVRECHLHVDDEEVREACDRVVQVLLRDEHEENEAGGWAGVEEEEDDEKKIVEIF